MVDFLKECSWAYSNVEALKCIKDRSDLDAVTVKRKPQCHLLAHTEFCADAHATLQTAERAPGALLLFLWV